MDRGASTRIWALKSSPKGTSPTNPSPPSDTKRAVAGSQSAGASWASAVRISGRPVRSVDAFCVSVIVIPRSADAGEAVTTTPTTARSATRPPSNHRRPIPTCPTNPSLFARSKGNN